MKYILPAAALVAIVISLIFYQHYQEIKYWEDLAERHHDKAMKLILSAETRPCPCPNAWLPIYQSDSTITGFISSEGKIKLVK